MAKVVPGAWTLTNSAPPSGEKVAPSNSSSLSRLWASGNRGGSDPADHPLDELHQAPTQVDHRRQHQELEVPGRPLPRGGLLGGRLGDLPAAGRARAVGLEGVGVEEAATGLAPGHLRLPTGA